MNVNNFSEDELRKCEDSPAYFYNKNVRKKGQKKLTNEEFESFKQEVIALRNTPQLKYRCAHYPLTINQCKKP